MTHEANMKIANDKAWAVTFPAPGGPEVLRLEERKLRVPLAKELVVQVSAAGINRADLMQRRGRYSAPQDSPQDVLGVEFAGIVLQVGEGVTRFKKNDRVMGLVGGGAQASMLVVHEDDLLSVPASISDLEAAALLESFVTGYDALRRAKEAEDSSVLIHAITSGVGLATAQLASLANAHVFGTSRSQSKSNEAEQWLRNAMPPSTQLSLHISHEAKFSAWVLAHTEGKGVSRVIDLVGAAYFQENLESLAPRGVLVCVGLVGGVKSEMPLGLLLSKRLTIAGTVLRSRSRTEKRALLQNFEADILPHIASGLLRVPLFRSLPAAQIVEAHRALEANESIGRWVLSFE